MSDENKPQEPQSNPERKTLDQGNAMSDMERLRHSCTHVLTAGIFRLRP